MVLSSKKVLFIFLLIVALSAVFRITNLDLVEFKIDEASNLLLASRPLFGHPFPYGGIVASIGILNPPLFNYLLFPLVFISLDPKFSVFIIAIINSLAIGILFLIIKKYYSLGAALIASLILAFSPWSIIFSRKIWPPDLIFPFSVLLFLSIHKIIIEKKTVFWTLFILSSLFLIQLDLSSGFFIFLIFILIFIQKPKLSLKFILLGLLLGSLPAFPYLIYEFKNNCPDCILLLSVNKQLIKTTFDVFIKPLQILSQGDFRFILGNDTLTFANKFPLIFKLETLFYIEYLLMPIGMFLFWKKYKTLRFLVYATLALPFIYFVFRVEAFMHYFVVLIPFLAVFLSTAFYSLMKSKTQLLRYVSIFVFLAIIVYSMVFNISLFKLIRQENGLNGDYGPSLSKMESYLQKKFVKYKNRSDFQEIILSSYIPLSLIHGQSPFAKMLYPYEETQKNLKSLEEKIKIYPDDPRLIQQLSVYYTTKEPNKKTATYLKKMSLISPAYEDIFHEVHELYLRFENDY